ncbi:MAG: UDP-glucose 4-epimerase GalE [Methylocystaceae bacterium]|nr:UDP-glucose 4-epimerase GalE [Methylocystaceae bacterium]
MTLNNNGTILVTGGAGYIGSHTTLSLLESGYDVVILDNLSTGSKEAVPEEAELIVGDIDDEMLVNAICKDYQIKAVIHFAGSIIVPESVISPLSYYENNVSKTIIFLNVLHASGVEKVIFSSTAAVYGYAQTDEPIQENALVSPLSPYGTSKLMIEWVLRDMSMAYDFNYIVLRYFNVAGADPQGRTGQRSLQTTHLIKMVCETILGEQKELVIFGDDYNTPDGTCVRDYIHVSDLADAHVKALVYLMNNKKSEIFNCGYGTGNSVKDIVVAAEKVSGEPFPVHVGPRRAGDPPSLIANSNKIRSDLQWEPKYDDLSVIVKTALDWEKKELSQKSLEAESPNDQM